VKVSSGQNLMAGVFFEIFQDKDECEKEFRIHNYTSRSIVFAAFVI
jgi:hypothetical protein